MVFKVMSLDEMIEEVKVEKKGLRIEILRIFNIKKLGRKGKISKRLRRSN